MARPADRLPENEPGSFFVDTSCIDCDTCRQLAPSTFGRLERAGQSFVHYQPAGADQTRRALMALVSCPTASIGSEASGPQVKEAARALPERIAGEVYYCGYASEASYGASSYLVRRPQGNVLIDSPRFARPLVSRLEELGGVQLMVLSHQDDVADHAAFAGHFGCPRVMHRDDLSAGTREVERPLSGADPIPLADDLLAIPVPGHTRGSLALLHRAGGTAYLFTGDHLWGSENACVEAVDGAAAALEASRAVCWYSWTEQTRSMRRLLELGLGFEWVLPGHGRRFHAPAAEMREQLARLVAQIEAALR
jgi:glyoxylase-like metal-dependent hydrolase (beta-lactamase superfamily II)/ferredoxin